MKLLRCVHREKEVFLAKGAARCICALALPRRSCGHGRRHGVEKSLLAANGKVLDEVHVPQ